MKQHIQKQERHNTIYRVANPPNVLMLFCSIKHKNVFTDYIDKTTHSTKTGTTRYYLSNRKPANSNFDIVFQKTAIYTIIIVIILLLQ